MSFISNCSSENQKTNQQNSNSEKSFIHNDIHKLTPEKTLDPSKYLDKNGNLFKSKF